MNITDVKVRKTFSEGNLKALISITLDNDFAVHDIKVISGKERLFVAMPSRKDNKGDNGGFKDIVHPITAEARQVLEEKVLSAYHAHVAAHSEDKPKTTAAEKAPGA